MHGPVAFCNDCQPSLEEIVFLILVVIIFQFFQASCSVQKYNGQTNGKFHPTSNDDTNKQSTTNLPNKPTHAGAALLNSVICGNIRGLYPRANKTKPLYLQSLANQLNALLYAIGRHISVMRCLMLTSTLMVSLLLDLIDQIEKVVVL